MNKHKNKGAAQAIVFGSKMHGFSAKGKSGITSPKPKMPEVSVKKKFY